MRRWMSILLALLCALAPGGGRADGCAHFITHGDRTVCQVAVTVDDWWEPSLLTEFLEVADEFHVKLTLYPCGFNLHEQDRALWQRVLNEGHEIGSHGYTHTNYLTRTYEQVAHDFDRFGDALDATLGSHYDYLTVRVPNGGGWEQGSGGHVGRACHAAGFDHVIFWDICDTFNVPAALKNIKNGSIVLLHANRHDLKFFRALMQGLEGRGFEYVTISQLLNVTSPLSDGASAAAAK